MKKAHNHIEQYPHDSFLVRYVLIILSILLLVGTTLVYWISLEKSQALAERISIYEASHFADLITQYRAFYAKHNDGKIENHIADYHELSSAALSSGASKAFNHHLKNIQNEFSVRLFSDAPFASQANNNLDEFEEEALARLKQDPTQPVWKIEKTEKGEVIRYAQADLMTPSCIQCHNSYAGTPKNDWKEGDMRGVLSITHSLNRFKKEAENTMVKSFLMLAALGSAMMLILFLVLRGLKVSLLTAKNAAKEAKLANQRLILGIEERDTLAEHLRESQIKTRTIIDSVTDVIIVIDTNGSVIEVNQAIKSMLGYEQQDIVGHEMTFLLEMNDTELTPFIVNKTKIMPFSAKKLIAKCNDDSLLDVELCVNEAKIGEETIYTGIIRDITQRILSKKKLAEARDSALESARLKSEFLANMSHEIRTPMNGVIGMSNLLLESKLNHEQRDLTKTVLHSAESLLRIINDILDFSKIEVGKLTIQKSYFELLPLIEGVMDLLVESTNNKGIELAYFIDANVPTTIHSDPIRLRQIIINFLNNSIKFTEKGFVLLKVSRLPHDNTHQVLLRFDIVDSGCGIPHHALQHLFQAFSQVDGSLTRQHGGTGLGLAICKQLVELMGGTIGVTSQIHQGSNFWFTTLHQAIELEPIDKLDNFSVLIFNANQQLSDYYYQQLSEWGLQPVSVTSIPQLITKLKKDPILSLIVIDADAVPFAIHDPEGILAILRMIRECSPIPILIYGSAKQIESLLPISLGRHVNLLTKPIRHSIILRTLRQLKYFTRNKTNDTQQNNPSQLAMPMPVFSTQNEPTPTFQPQKIRILLTEDHLINQKVAMAILKKLGYQHIDCALNGQEALMAVQKKDYDIVLMDCQMPIMDGYEATRQIRALADVKYHSLVIIALTAHTMKGDDEKCFTAGMNDYLSKPVRQQALKDCLERWHTQKTP